jgi:hypothetical protein
MTLTTHPFTRALVAAIGVTLCLAASAANISKPVHDQAQSELKAAFKAEREACNRQTGNAKDVCEETVKGREKVAMAHLEYQRSGTPRDMNKLVQARYDARYEVAKEMCDDQSGNAKDVCVAQAKAEHDKAKANAKASKQVAEARADASEERMKADYKVASERCDAMSGQAKDSCQAAARARFGQ